jgi:hypothetical protein
VSVIIDRFGSLKSRRFRFKKRMLGRAYEEKSNRRLEKIA